MTNPRKRTKPGITVEYRLLSEAIRWESIRNEYFSRLGAWDQAMSAELLKRTYQQRTIDEAHLHGVKGVNGKTVEDVFQ